MTDPTPIAESVWLDWEAYQSERNAAIAELKSETAIDFSVDEPEPQELTAFEEGSGKVTAVLAWLQAVEVAAVAAQVAGNTVERDRLVEVAATFAEHPTVRAYAGDSYDAWITDVIEPARSGDLTAMRAEAHPTEEV